MKYIQEFLPLAEVSEDLKKILVQPTDNMVICKVVRLPNLILTDANGNIVAKIENRYSVIKMLWNDGPGPEFIDYMHTITVISASTDLFRIELKWFNQGGGLEQTETISDHVECIDHNRKTNWTFSAKQDACTHIIKMGWEVLENIQWKKCN